MTTDAVGESSAFPQRYARRVLLASLVSVGMGFTVVFPVLAPLGREIGLTEFEITFVIGISALTVFLVSPIWGRTSDRIGRKRVLLVGLFGYAAGTVLFNSVLYAGLNGWLAGTLLFLALIVARMMHAAVMAAAMPAANAYMADITSAGERTRGMGMVGAANNVGSIVGPAVASLAVISLLTPLWVMAAVALLNGLFVLRFLPEAPRPAASTGPHGPTPGRMRYTDPRIFPFVVLGVSMFTGIALVQQTMGFRFQDVLELDAAATATTFGAAMMLAAVCSLISQVLIVQRLALPPVTLLRLALPLMIAAFTIMATLETRFWLTAAMMIQGLGMGLAGPGFMAGASLAVSSREQGAVAGIAGSCPPLGFALGPLIGGALYQWGPSIPYAFAAGLYAVLLVGMGIWGRHLEVHAHGQQEPRAVAGRQESPTDPVARGR